MDEDVFSDYLSRIKKVIESVSLEDVTDGQAEEYNSMLDEMKLDMEEDV